MLRQPDLQVIQVDPYNIHLEDGVPAEVRASAPPNPEEEPALLLRLELEFGLWLVWEDAWRREGHGVRRPIDLARSQPTHRVTFTPDQGAIAQYLLIVDSHTGSPCASAWLKHEWFSPGHLSGGIWSRTREGWRVRQQRTPGSICGVLCIEPLGPRPVSHRRSH